MRRLNERNTPRTDIKGNPLPGVYTESFFGFAFSEDAESSENVSLESSIEKILDALQPFRDQLKNLSAMGGDAAFFIGLFIEDNAGLVLDRSLLERITAYGMSLEFDIYSPGQSRND